jgi:hypothetical protein
MFLYRPGRLPADLRGETWGDEAIPVYYSGN